MHLFKMINAGGTATHIRARNISINNQDYSIDMYDLTHPTCINEGITTISLELHTALYADMQCTIDYPVIIAGMVFL